MTVTVVGAEIAEIRFHQETTMPAADDIRWFKEKFRSQIEPALTATPFDVDMIVAIASQETGYIWSVLRKKQLPLERVVALCVGDTIDFKGPGKGRQAFPRTKDALVAAPNGQMMFDIARKALEDMAAYIPGYHAAVANPNKFCHGYGVFQRDLQFFKDDPDYFLEIRILTQRLEQGAQVEVETDLGDYEKIGGVFFPFSIEAGPKGSQDKQKIIIEKAEANVPVEDGVFKFPPAPSK